MPLASSAIFLSSLCNVVLFFDFFSEADCSVASLLSLLLVCTRGLSELDDDELELIAMQNGLGEVLNGIIRKIT